MKLLSLAAASTVLLVAGVLYASTSSEIRPKVPEVSPCTQWRGAVHGNDPDVQIVATLCRGDGGKVTGVVRWSSVRSGTNERDVVGTWSPQALTLRDVRVVGQPRRGWRFCAIDHYDLEPTSRGLVGSYYSSACHDDARIELVPAR